MAHELKKNDHMVSAKNLVPWHGLGTVLPDDTLTAEQALKAAKLNWTVEQREIFDADMTPIKGYRMNQRSDDKTCLSVVRDTWTPVQNDQLLGIAEALAQAGDGLDYQPRIETAGSLSGGKIVWALVRVKEAKCLGSSHLSYLLLSNGHDGTRAVKGTLTDVRVVCNNTLRAAEARASLLSVKHTRNVMERVNEAAKLLGWANDATDATFAIYKALAATKLKADAANELFKELIPGADDKDNTKAGEKVDKLMWLFRNGPGVEGKTVFDALNAVTDFVDHHRDFRTKEGNAERRFLYSTFGGEGDRIKAAVFSKAQELAGV